MKTNSSENPFFKCDRCKIESEKKWNHIKKKYSDINDVSYWTEGKNYKNYKLLCRDCLQDWYQKENEIFVSLVSYSKRKIFNNYQHLEIFKEEIKSPFSKYNKKKEVMSEKQTSSIQNGRLKNNLKEVIDSNSRLIPHIKDNLFEIEENESYYLGQQGWSVENEKKEKFGIHSIKNYESFRETRIYHDSIENIKRWEEQLEGFINSADTEPKITNRLFEEKLSLLGVRFSKRLDDALIQQICQMSNFNSEVITRTKKVNLQKFLQWVINNTSKMINTTNPSYSKDSQGHGNLAIDIKDLILLVNQPLMDEIRLKEIFGEIKLVNYLKDLKIIDHYLPSNWQGILINKRALWYSYEIKEIIKKQDHKYFLEISYEVGILPFAGACAYLKE